MMTLTSWSGNANLLLFNRNTGLGCPWSGASPGVQVMAVEVARGWGTASSSAGLLCGSGSLGSCHAPTKQRGWGLHLTKGSLCLPCAWLDISPLILPLCLHLTFNPPEVLLGLQKVAVHPAPHTQPARPSCCSPGCQRNF